MIAAALLWVFGNTALPVVNGQQRQTVTAGTLGVPVEVVDRKAEFNVKAVYLYNFARYIEWPAHKEISDGTFHIGVLGETGVMTPLQKIARFKKVVNKRTGAKLSIQLTQYTTLEECRPCHILFVAENVDLALARQLRNRFDSQPVLIVGETISFATQGGTAEFLLINGGVQFALNIEQTNAKNLKLDAKLLKAANRIIDQSAIKPVSQN